MKSFHFPLERVLAWRRLQVQIVESELERLHAEHHATQSRMISLTADRATFQVDLIATKHLDGTDLGAFNAFLNHSRDEHFRMHQALSVYAAKIKAQMEVVSDKRRDVRLLEKMRERRAEAWSVELSREIQQLAEDTHLGRWKRGQKS
jgi:flagellar export protein FliJ